MRRAAIATLGLDTAWSSQHRFPSTALRSSTSEEEGRVESRNSGGSMLDTTSARSRILDYGCRRGGSDRRAGALHPRRRRTPPFTGLLSAGRSLHGQYGAISRRVLAGTVFGARAWVGLRVCMRVSVVVGLGEVGE
jgi:hypothetical protein